MIDLHSHILPELDDGSKNVKMSLEMLRRSARQGVRLVAFTPHFYPLHNTPERFLKERQAAVERLGQLPEDAPQVLLGAEVAYFEGISRSEELIPLQLGNTGLLLVEMPFTGWNPRMVEELRELQSNLGLTPVLAHIDRYLGKKQYHCYSRMLEAYGVLLQCNAEPFLHLLRRRKVLKLVKQKKIDFLGSDAHNLDTRAPNLHKAAEVISHILGKNTMDALTERSKELLGL